MTLSQFRNRVRVAMVLDRLADGHESLAGLSAELGFVDQSHLSRVVRDEHRRAAGKAPTAIGRCAATRAGRIRRGMTQPTDQPGNPGQRVTPLELFFDLVFVFAITQVTGFLAASRPGPACSGASCSSPRCGGRGGLCLADEHPRPGGRRRPLAVFASIGAMLVGSLAVPAAFGSDGVTSASRTSSSAPSTWSLYTIAGRGDPELLRAVL